MKPAPAIVDPTIVELRAMLDQMRTWTVRLERALGEAQADAEPPPMGTREIAARAGVSLQCARNWIKRYRWGPLIRGRYLADRRLAEAFLNERGNFPLG